MSTTRVTSISQDRPEGRGGQGPDGQAGSFRFELEFGRLPAGIESERDRRRLVLILTHPDFRGLERQIFDVGACVDPIRMRVSTLRTMPLTGEIAEVARRRDLPFGVILIRCMNRRASRCPSCARIYQGDTYQLVRAGIAGGKGVPVSVAANPQVFATLTAPSFGAVHRAADPDSVCRQRNPARCPHGRERGCRERHGPDDPLIGQPLCRECYDYPGQVVWNAHASRLCKGLMDNLYHHLARHAGVARKEIRSMVRVEYARVAEYQARGAVHFHLVLRLDGGDGQGSPAPAWASAEVLIEALASARRATSVTVPCEFGGARVLRFGGQPERVGEPVVLDGDGYTARKVASYLAKYVSKGTEDAHGSDAPVRRPMDIEDAGKTPHVRALMRSAWRLGGMELYAQTDLHRRWCHMLGYGGHVLTTSQGYSVTRGLLRQARAEHRAGQVPAATVEAVERSLFSYAGRGYGSVALEELAEDAWEDMEFNRQTARDALDGVRQEAGDAA
jgi:hypothetical protein